MTYKVIIPAAGLGKRMGAGKNKLLLELNEVPILIHTLRVFEKDDLCDGIILSISPQEEELFKELLKTYQINKVEHFVHGGKERQHSVFNGLKVLAGFDGIVLVHDGARPFIDTMLIHELVAVTSESGAAVLAVPVKDTIKKVANDEVVETVERASLWAIQTPQAFRVSLLMEANIKAEEDRFVGTDDASLVERLNYPIKIVKGNYDNIKLTTPEDLYFAEAIIRKLEKI
ncbi:2-C-methyl-D-erythritol 4-phosphate cytidylyltransferase [Bacillus sp. 31A1R]|uniref:2-C-methyl-D-erythritol 4-phosphate cytidylyltransferase n=1 Tax=Robertmurraya mangrovi TaxID=3098077 RepID=A0ABU5J4D9_9BACI|nr:2-C-methyl-D-erythritol 4-phosphate cytidylyltransferase [Bacillus sp. 31A1R]MDZ5474289.1 2-C-methyl-D-erythritol 4-phosphate cytidylyltransferase [Bacillus sp. 31A1R]